jgi:hypothetical protein
MPIVPGPSSQAVMPFPAVPICSQTDTSSALRSAERCSPPWQEHGPNDCVVAVVVIPRVFAILEFFFFARVEENDGENTVVV